MSTTIFSGGAQASAQQNAYQNQANEPRSEQLMVDMIRADLGVSIEPQAWRLFVRYRFDRLSVLAHRIHDGKR